MPWLLSRFASVNAAVLFIALLFFGWLWGVAGLLLGAPLVAIAKVDLRPHRLAQSGGRIARALNRGARLDVHAVPPKRNATPPVRARSVVLAAPMRLTV